MTAIASSVQLDSYLNKVSFFLTFWSHLQVSDWSITKMSLQSSDTQQVEIHYQDTDWSSENAEFKRFWIEQQHWE